MHMGPDVEKWHDTALTSVNKSQMSFMVTKIKRPAVLLWNRHSIETKHALSADWHARRSGGTSPHADRMPATQMGGFFSLTNKVLQALLTETIHTRA